MGYGNSIELFLVNGTADSTIVAELSNWNGMALKIPRIEVSACNRKELTQPGVYFLFSKEVDGTDSVYIGEAENVKERLLQHIRDYDSDREKYYWNTAVIFVGRDLNKAHIRYLENKIVEIAKSCKRYVVLTKNTFHNAVLKESQIAVMDEFIDHVKILIETLGYKVLTPLFQQSPAVSSGNDEILYLSSGGVNAKGIVTAEGFVVLRGSSLNEKTSEKSLYPGMLKLRSKIMSSDKVKDLTMTEDILFTSASAAADFVPGYSVSGPKGWKMRDGRSLKDIEQADEMKEEISSRVNIR